MKYTITLTEEEMHMVMNGLFERSYLYYTNNHQDKCVPYDELLKKINKMFLERKEEKNENSR